jgi:RNA polymerase sigma factor (sigma-70 family)
VYSAISRYRKARTMVLVGDFGENDNIIAGRSCNNNALEANDILKLIQQLPETQRAVFNMYAIEGYSHKEIGENLGMTEIMSRTTLSRARGILKNRIYEMESRELHRIAI